MLEDWRITIGSAGWRRRPLRQVVEPIAAAEQVEAEDAVLAARGEVELALDVGGIQATLRSCCQCSICARWQVIESQMFGVAAGR
jgi:hypothetical protein